jgi:hypothetical protein
LLGRKIRNKNGTRRRETNMRKRKKNKTRDKGREKKARENIGGIDKEGNTVEKKYRWDR